MQLYFPAGLALIAGWIQAPKISVAQHFTPKLMMFPQADPRIMQTAARFFRVHVHMRSELGGGVPDFVLAAESGEPQIRNYRCTFHCAVPGMSTLMVTAMISRAVLLMSLSVLLVRTVGGVIRGTLLLFAVHLVSGVVHGVGGVIHALALVSPVHTVLWSRCCTLAPCCE